MKKDKILHLCFFLILIFFGCKKSNQDFTYQAVNELKITPDAATFIVSVSDTLKINPVYTETIPGDEFTYNWEYFSSTIKAVKISEDKNLKFPVTLKVGSYSVRLKMTSTKTGIQYIQRWTLTVSSPYTPGWYVASNKNGVGSVAFIRTTDNVIFTDPMQVVNNKNYPGRALGIFPVNRSYAAYGTQSLLYYFTDQGKFRLTLTDLLEHSRNEAFMPGVPFTTLPGTSTDNYFNIDQFVIEKGNLYISTGSTITKFTERIPGDYLMYPEAFALTSGVNYFYDQKNKHFWYTGTQDRELFKPLPTTTGTQVFDVANTGMTMIAHGRTIDAITSEYYFLMQNSAGVRYMYAMLGTNTKANYVVNGPEISLAKFMQVSKIVKQAYYATNNKIYLHDLLNNTSRLIYTFPAGYTIKDFKIQQSTSKTLVVGADIGTVGEVFFFDIEPTGDFTNGTFTRTYTGFGEIANLNVR